MPTTLQRTLAANHLGNRWLASKTGLPLNRINRLTIGYARWKRSEADAVAEALAAETARPVAEVYAQLFTGVEIRPDKAAVA